MHTHAHARFLSFHGMSCTTLGQQEPPPDVAPPPWPTRTKSQTKALFSATPQSMALLVAAETRPPQHEQVNVDSC